MMVYIAGNNNFKVEDILDLVHEKQNKPASNPFAGKSLVLFFFGGGSTISYETYYYWEVLNDEIAEIYICVCVCYLKFD